MPLLPFARAEGGLAKIIKNLKGPPILWCLPIAPYPQRLTHALHALTKVCSRRVAKHSLTRTRIAPTQSSTLALPSHSVRLNRVCTSSIKLRRNFIRLTLMRLLPTSTPNDSSHPPGMTWRVVCMVCTSCSSNPGRRQPLTLGRLDFLACGTNQSKNIAKKAHRTSPGPSHYAPNQVRSGVKSEVAHLWARWLHNPCRLGDPLRYRAGGKTRSGPLVGKVAT